ncbi:hypothetical protein E1B28_001805 [Marasmius oreades]|nr:uncharacterized protein E1B28_001805 [Marasmius oreades]KAG7100019.1 hypothetical protein E1B28_001805 [Marasmius oreades]
MSKDWTRIDTETSSAVNEQIDDFERQHSKAMEQLCDSTVAAYHTDRHYRNMSYNELLDLEPHERKQSVKEARGEWAMDTVFTATDERELSLAKSRQNQIHNKRVPYPFHSTYSRNPLRTLSTISRLRYSYLKRIIPMRVRRDELKEKERETELQREYNERRREEERKRWEEEERRRKAAQFPQSLEEFKQKGVDVQRRVARFLCLGDMFGHKGSESGLSPAQEKMLKEWKWTVEEVVPMKRIFATNKTFAAEMQALDIANQSVTRDPRNRY